MKKLSVSHRKLGEAGFSLVEVLISSTILSILTVASLESLTYFQRSSMQVENSTAADGLISSVIANGQATLAFQQRDYASTIADAPELINGELRRVIDDKMGLQSDFTESMARLPLAFSNDNIGPVATCGNCRGHYGIYTQRSPMVGLAVTTVRVGIDSPGAPGVIREYNFLTPAY